MSAEENMALARRFIEAAIKGNLDEIDKMLTPDYVSHNKLLPGQEPGPEGVKRATAQLSATVSNASVLFEDQVAAADKVVTRFIVRGTHQGETEEFGPPTGRQFEVEVTTMHRLEGGKIVEEWERYDNLSFMQQLGLAAEQ
jgi:predicted ester cyclase